MLEHIHIEGYKSFSTEKPLDIDLRNVNVLIGPNGAGKSNLVSFFDMLEVLLSGKWNSYVSYIDSTTLFHYGSSITSEINASFVFSDNKCKFRLLPDNRGGVMVDTLDSDKEVMKDLFSTVRAFHFNDTSSSSVIHRMNKRSDNLWLYSDAGNLWSFLLRIREEYKWYYDRIMYYIQYVVPQIDEILLVPNAAGNFRMQWRDKSSLRYNFQSTDFSDGSLRFIALAVLLLQPEELLPSLIVIDEPELGLHPAAIEILSWMIGQAGMHTQIIIATQSTDLINEVDPENVMVVENEKVKGRYQSSVNRLDSKKLEEWLEDYTLSQLWKKNIFGGLPV